MLFRCVVFLSALLCLSGCASLRTERNYGVTRTHDPGETSTWTLYLPNRVLDGADMLTGGLMFGTGFNLRLRAFSRHTHVITEKNSGLALGWNTQWNDPLQAHKSGYFIDRYAPASLGAHGGTSIELASDPADTGELYNSPDTLGLGFQLAIIGADIGFRPLEIADFLTGFFLIDLHRDDMLWVKDIGKNVN